MNIAIVEDNKTDRDNIISCIKRYSSENLIKTEICAYQCADTFLQEYKPGQFDLVFLDIEMPMLDGFSAAQQLRERDPVVVLIFVTNLTSYALKGYSVGAFDYILKPVTWSSFSAYFSRACKRIAPRVSDLISIRAGGKDLLLRAASIYYVECQNHTLHIITDSAPIHLTGRISDLEKKLSDYHFYRCHSGFVINLQYVEGYHDDMAVVHGFQIPVSRRKRLGFLQALSHYMSV